MYSLKSPNDVGREGIQGLWWGFGGFGEEQKGKINDL